MYSKSHSIRTDRELLADTIRKIRERLGETQEEFARRLKTSQSTIDRHESGNIAEIKRSKPLYQLIFELAEGAEEQEPFSRVFGVIGNRAGVDRGNSATRKVERVTDPKWLGLIEEIADRNYALCKPNVEAVA